MIPPIRDFIVDYSDLKKFLTENSQITLMTSVENHFRKVFLLSCASYYENDIQEIIKSFLAKHSYDEKVVCFATNKGISRQYHTYFKWDDSNVNSFLGLFGSEFKTKISAELKTNEEMNNCMKAFLTIGNERNKMVHENFLLYQLEKTFEEIQKLNEDALKFVEYLRNVFK